MKRTLLECLVDSDGSDYEFKSLASDGLAIIDVLRHDGREFSETELYMLQSACNMYKVIFGEEWKCSYLQDSYRIRIHSFNDKEMNVRIVNSMIKYEKGVKDVRYRTS